jgi:hypothetical protein
MDNDSGRGLKEQSQWCMLACGGDKKEADHSIVNCVGLFDTDGWKDNNSCKEYLVVEK